MKKPRPQKKKPSSSAPVPPPVENQVPAENPPPAPGEPWAEWTRQLAMELMFAEPGKDAGLLPLNNLLLQLEEFSQTNPLPSELSSAIGKARQTVDGIFERTARFDESSLAWLREWNVWMQTALDARQRQQPLPEMPAAWSAAESTSETSSSPPVGSVDAPEAPGLSSAAEPLPAELPTGAVAAAEASPPAETPRTETIADLPLELDLEQDADLLREFVTESEEHLQNIELGVLVLEDNPVDADTLNSIFRAFHTFKGGSGFLRLTPVNRLAHELESLLDLARQHKLSITSPIIDVILEGADCLKQFIAEIQNALGAGHADSIIIPTNALVARVKAVITAPEASTTAPAPTPAIAAPAAPTASQASASPDLPAADSAAVPPAPVATAKPATNRRLSETAVVKVDTFKLDSLMDLVGELVIAQSMVAQDGALKSLQSQRLNRNLAQLSGITRELQKVTMSLRMVPIRPTFQKMNRLVRDLAAKQDKQVELRMSGEETELDRTITEELTDPLVHMIRNSVDHGIESPARREAQGKRPQGTIFLRAFHEGGSIMVEIQDDGAGLDQARILAKARDRGLVRADEQLAEKEVFDLIFAPGFSTAEQVTDISGRGVGMDVVRRNIEKLRGTISIQSTPGRGSTFTISLPLTLAIIDGFIVGVGAERFILPTYSVRESFRPTPEMISTLHDRLEMVNVRGRLSPLLRLHDFFGVPAAKTDPTQGIILLVETGVERRCLLVDQLLGKQEVVIKSLGDMFKQSPALAGAAIMGDGRVGLILDVSTLVRLKSAPLARAA